MAGETKFKKSVIKDKTGNVLTANPKQAAIASLNMTVSATPTQAEVQAIANKVDAILVALRAANIIST